MRTERTWKYVREHVCPTTQRCSAEFCDPFRTTPSTYVEECIGLQDCLFCKLVAGEIPSEKVFEDEQVLAFQDIRPQTPVHLLVIPKQHIASAQSVVESDTELIGHLHAMIPHIAEKAGISEKGYRVVTNIGHHGQQTVPHLHYHVLGGRQLGWPPG